MDHRPDTCHRWRHVHIKTYDMNYSDKIKEIAASVFNVEVSEIHDELAAGELDAWDSVGNLALLTSIEEELEVDIPIEDIFELTTIGAIIEEINRLKNE